MARGDGKAVKGRTKGKMLGTKRMATGGFASSDREGGFAGAGTGRLESPGQRSSVSPGGGNISAGNTPGGGFGGGGGGDRQTSSARPSGGSPAGQMARLGNMPASAMTQAGIDSGRAQMLASVMNSLQDTRPASIRGTEIQSLTPGGKIADRIEPTMGYIPQPNFPSVPKAPQYPAGRLPGYIDQKSIVPGSVSFTQASQFTPFAQTPTGQSLLARSQQPMTRAEAEALAKSLPAGTNLSGNFFGATLAGYGAPSDVSQFNQYPATIADRSFTVNVPKTAGLNVPTGPKIGQYNPGVSPTAPKPISDRVAAQPGVVTETRTKQIYDRIPQGGTPQARATPSPVVAPGRGQNFMPGDRPGGGMGGRDRDDRPIRKKKKPIVEEGTTAAKNGGLISRGDGKAACGKTKGRYI